MILADGQQASAQAAEIIRRGGLIAFRTDTFYGLGADPLNQRAVARIKQLKGREDTKPILVVISNLDQIGRFIAAQSEVFTQLAGTFWPGPLTLVGQARENLPKDLTAGSETIGLRLPDDALVRNLIQLCGGALTATSANPSRERPATTAQECVGYFATKLDLIIDGGPSRIDAPSTVVDTSGSVPRLIREGLISRSVLDRELKANGLQQLAAWVCH